MPLIRMNLFSQSLNMYTTVNITLPDSVLSGAQDLPCVYLLHGLADDADAWLNFTGALRYAQKRGIALVMPDGGLSCYENMVHGEKYADYIAHELPAHMRACFPLSKAREKTFIAGCSMGGFGAMKIGFAHPHAYCAVGCLSSAHMEYRPKSPHVQHVIECVYGSGIDQCDRLTEQNLAAAFDAALPMRLFHVCGDADFIRENAQKTRRFIESHPHPSLEYHFELLPGRHDWTLWDRAAESFFEWLELPETEGIEQ